MRSRILFLAIAIVALVLGGCQVDEPTATAPSVAQAIHGEAQVEHIEILILESMPMQVRVVATGNLPDGCTEIDQATSRREGNVLFTTITTRRPADVACTEALVPFEESFSLDVEGLPAGVYTVNVNGVTGTFEFTVDNVSQEPDTGTEPGARDVITREAGIGSIAIQIMESMPVQVSVMAKGLFPDGCTKIDQIMQEREGTTFLVTITTARPTGAMCTQAVVPFEETFRLDVENLPAGVYTVDVNDVTDTFELTVNNVRKPDEITTGEAPVGRIDINLMESFPVQASVTIHGNLPDGCTQISHVVQTTDGYNIMLDVFTERPIGALCTQAVVPFEQTLPLDIDGLPAGTYTVDVNSVIGTFELAVANVSSDVISDDPMPACLPAEEGLVPFLNGDDGYCLLYPSTFEANSPQRGILVITGPALTEDPEPLRVSLTIHNEGAADGRTAEEIADERLSEFEAREVPIERDSVSLGGEKAVGADSVPGRMLSRQVFVVHNNTVYVMTLAPVDADFPEATGQAEDLWETTLSSFTFVQE